jgi:hypothetical protein
MRNGEQQETITKIKTVIFTTLKTDRCGFFPGTETGIKRHREHSDFEIEKIIFSLSVYFFLVLCSLYHSRKSHFFVPEMRNKYCSLSLFLFCKIDRKINRYTYTPSMYNKYK